MRLPQRPGRDLGLPQRDLPPLRIGPGRLQLLLRPPPARLCLLRCGCFACEPLVQLRSPRARLLQGASFHPELCFEASGGTPGLGQLPLARLVRAPSRHRRFFGLGQPLLQQSRAGHALGALLRQPLGLFLQQADAPLQVLALLAPSTLGRLRQALGAVRPRSGCRRRVRGLLCPPPLPLGTPPRALQLAR